MMPSQICAASMATFSLMNACWLPVYMSRNARHERDASRPIRVVLNSRHFARDVFLVALEVDDAIQALVTAAAPPRGELAVIVAAAGAVQVLDERLVRLAGRDVVERLDRLKAAAGRRRFVSFDRHLVRPLEELGQLLAFAQFHVGLLPIRALVRRSAPGVSPCRARSPVRTCSTFEPSSVSIARLISVLFAWVATSDTIVRPSCSRWMDVFSVMSGRRITSVSS